MGLNNLDPVGRRLYPCGVCGNDMVDDREVKHYSPKQCCRVCVEAWRKGRPICKEKAENPCFSADSLIASIFSGVKE